MRIVSIADVAAIVRGRRLDSGMSQGQLAERAHVSRKWVNEFEAGGKPTAELGHVMRVLQALGVTLRADPADDGGDENRSILDDVLEGLRRG